MARRPIVPAQLTRGPFTLADAARCGISRDQLTGKTWRRVGPALYCWVGWAVDSLAILRAVAASRPPAAVFSGRTAAWLHGLDLPPCDPIEVTIPDLSVTSSWRGTTIRRRQLSGAEVVRVKGLPATSALRTVVDLGRDLPLMEAVAAVDMAMHGGLTDRDALQSYVRAHPRGFGAARLSRVAGLADPAAESPMESRLRVLVLQARLPHPESQASLYAEDGRFLARVDLFYRPQRLAIEYDGATHRDRLVEDNRRQNAVLSAGFQMLRFTSADVLGRPDMVISQVRTALAA
jgi:hypothetical protein